MNHHSNDVNVSTPERKQEFINRWLEESVKINANRRLDYDEKTPPNSPHSKTKSNLQFLSPAQKSLFPHQTSPILGGKRSATSPIIGGTKRNPKRNRITKTISNNTAETALFSLSALKKNKGRK